MHNLKMSTLLVISTVSCLISSLIPHFVKPFLACLFVESNKERELRNVIAQLVDDKSNISAIDEFAQYARIERKLIRCKEKLKSLSNSRTASNLKKRLIITYTLQFIVGIFMAGLIWMYRTTPVVILPKNWLYPIATIVSWPTGVDGAISITAWVVISRTSIGAAVTAFTSTRK